MAEIARHAARFCPVGCVLRGLFNAGGFLCLAVGAALAVAHRGPTLVPSTVQGLWVVTIAGALNAAGHFMNLGRHDGGRLIDMSWYVAIAGAAEATLFLLQPAAAR